MTVLNDPPSDRKFNVWKKSELYWGENDSADGELYYPRTGDLVIDTEIGIYVVTAVVDYVPVITLLSRFSVSSTYNEQSTSLITATSGYQPSVAQRAYIDKSANPYAITIDCHYLAYGQLFSSMVFFRGTDVSDNGEVISEIYNSNDVLISNEVPMNALNATSTVWRPDTFYTTKELEAGETITGVIYRSDGNREAVQSFLLLDGASIRPSSASNVVITGVSLVSNMIDPDDDSLLVNQAGTPVKSMLAKGLIHYSDGSTVEHNIDGVKMVLLGLDGFDTSRIGTPYRLLLGYYPSDTEPFVNGALGENPFISKAYYLANYTTDPDYSLKVYIVPTWDTTNGIWTYSYRLINQEGDLEVDVTSLVTVLQEGTATPISGSDFTTEQNCVLSLDMEEISPELYEGYIHTQQFNITVDQPGAVSGQYFMLDYVGDGNSVYGNNVSAAINATGSILNLSQGRANQDLWLNAVYYPSEPLFDATELESAAEPTHFIIEYEGSYSDKIAITEWEADMAVPAVFGTLEEGKTLILRWVLETVDGDQLLSFSPLYIKASI